MAISFANHLYPGLISEEDISNKSVLSIGTCGLDSPATADPSVPAFSPCSGSQAGKQREFIEHIVAQGSVKYAIIDGLMPQQTPSTIARVNEGVDFLEAHGVTPIIFVPHITTTGDLKGCFARPLKPAQKCTFDATLREGF